MTTTDQIDEIDPVTAFLFEAFTPENRANPYQLYAKFRAEQPLLSSGTGLWMTFTHEVAHGLLRSRNTSSDESKSTEFKAMARSDERLQRQHEVEPLMLFVDPPDHTRLRTLVSRAFTPRTVRELRPRLDQLATKFLDDIDGVGPIDFVEQVAYRFPVTVICELLGVPVADVPTFESLSDDLTLTIEPGVLRTPEQDAAIDTARIQLAEYIGELLNSRRQQPGDDLISALLAVRDGDDRLTESELISLVTLLLMAGHETTVNLLGNGLVALLRNRDQLDRWRADPSIALAAVDEITRFDSPVQMAMRVMIEDTQLGDQVVPSGDQVITLLGAANRDPAVFADPDRLDLTRANAATNLSFGGGIHHCLGMALARTEAEVVLGQVVQRFSHLELAEEPPMRERFVLRGYERVLVDARS